MKYLHFSHLVAECPNRHALVSRVMLQSLRLSKEDEVKEHVEDTEAIFQQIDNECDGTSRVEAKAMLWLSNEIWMFLPHKKIGKEKIYSILGA